ncbi:MAG: Ig domain-containing protein [Bacteroidaceae bacterium]|nr:Ig domain-containing protein [Bacteroidaceae bacterium]
MKHLLTLLIATIATLALNANTPASDGDTHIVPTYRLRVDRGYIPSKMTSGSEGQGIYTTSAQTDAAIFAFIELPGVEGKYLYCTDNDQFIRTTDFNAAGGVNAFTDLPDGTFTTAKIDGSERYTIASTASGNYLQSGGSNQLCVTSWKTLDAGNQWTIEPYDDFDASPFFADGVTLNKTALTICPGVTETLIATEAARIPTGKLTWTSSDESVANVSPTGTVAFAAVGTATITVTTPGGATAQCIVTCELVNPESITLNKTTLTLYTDFSETLTPTFTPEISDHTLSWTTSDPSIATVSNEGLVKAISEGNATITATTRNGLTATCLVTVISSEGVILPTYRLYVDRGYLPNKMSTSGGSQGVYATTEAEAGLYALIEIPGADGRYLYCIDNDRFIKSDDHNAFDGVTSFLEKPDGTFQIRQITATNRYTIAATSTSHYLQFGGSNQLCVDSWDTLDSGNQWAIDETGTFDATAVIKKLYGIITGIHNPHTSIPTPHTSAHTHQTIFTLTATRRTSPIRGVNIVNGRKLIIR